MSIRSELTKLLAELKQLDWKYEFCLRRILHYYPISQKVDMSALLMYHESQGHIQEIERRALTIDACTTDLESIYNIE